MIKTPHKVVGVVFGKDNKPYFYKAPIAWPIELGDRVIVRKGESYSIPTVVGVYPAGGLNAEGATDWLVQTIDTTQYDELKLEDAL